jgi:hypothetical protein
MMREWRGTRGSLQVSSLDDSCRQQREVRFVLAEVILQEKAGHLPQPGRSKHVSIRENGMVRPRKPAGLSTSLFVVRKVPSSPEAIASSRLVVAGLGPWGLPAKLASLVCHGLPVSRPKKFLLTKPHSFKFLRHTTDDRSSEGTPFPV